MTSPAPTPLRPPRIPIPDGSQMSVVYSQNGQESVVVLGCITPTGDTGMNSTKAAAWLKAWSDAMRPLYSSNCSIVGARVRDVSGPDGQVIELGPPPTPAGAHSDTGASLAAGSTLIRWSTATGGRTGKGRSFVPGLPGSMVGTNGRGYHVQHQGFAATAIAAYLGNTIWTVDWKPAVLSFRRGLCRPITAGALATVVGVQRRRMR